MITSYFFLLDIYYYIIVNCIQLRLGVYMQYIIVKGVTLSLLEREVNKQIEEGYIPVGGVFMEPLPGGFIPKYYQAVVHKDILKK